MWLRLWPKDPLLLLMFELLLLFLLPPPVLKMPLFSCCSILGSNYVLVFEQIGALSDWF